MKCFEAIHQSSSGNSELLEVFFAFDCKNLLVPNMFGADVPTITPDSLQSLFYIQL